MRPVLALAKRNCLCYFRDRQSVLFSMMAALIVLLLYLLFLRDNLISSYPELPGMDRFVDVWVISGLLSIVSVTSCAGSLQTMVSDRIEGRDMDLLVTPMGPYRMAFGHILSTFVSGLMMTVLILAVGTVYLVATGCPLDAADVLLTLLLVVPSALSGCIIMYAVTSRIRSVGAFSGMFTIVSVLIGFVTGIYMPIGTMPGFVQGVSALVPATHMASLLRQTLAGTSLDQVLGGAPAQVVSDFRAELGFDISLGGFQFTPALSLLYVVAVTVLFFAVSVLLIGKR